MANTMDSFTRTYNSFSGVDMLVAFNNKIIGELQGISYTVQREKAPVYTMGSADPRSFSRGKRGIAGSMVFMVFDRSAQPGVGAQICRECFEIRVLWHPASQKYLLRYFISGQLTIQYYSIDIC